MRSDFPKGDIPVLILTVLADASRHGYAIAREIERLSEEALKLREGSLYPALRVLEQDGLIRGEWEIPTSGPARKVYSITEAGKTELAKRAAEWRRYARIMSALIGENGLEDGDAKQQPA